VVSEVSICRLIGRVVASNRCKFQQVDARGVCDPTAFLLRACQTRKSERRVTARVVGSSK
jgi:hypothetical protein